MMETLDFASEVFPCHEDIDYGYNLRKLMEIDDDTQSLASGSTFTQKIQFSQLVLAQA